MPVSWDCARSFAAAQEIPRKRRLAIVVTISEEPVFELPKAVSAFREAGELDPTYAAAPEETTGVNHVDAPNRDRDVLLRAATQTLEERFSIRHVTLQLESTDCPSDGHC